MSRKLKFKIWGRSDLWLLRYSTFNIFDFDPSVYFEVVFHWMLSLLQPSFNFGFVLSVKFKIWGRSARWLLWHSTFNPMRSSSFGCCLHFKKFSILVWSPKLKFKIWVRSDQWLLRYSTFNILMLSSIGGSLLYNHHSILVLTPQLKFKICSSNIYSDK